jgi:hypothetical protein
MAPPLSPHTHKLTRDSGTAPGHALLSLPEAHEARSWYAYFRLCVSAARALLAKMGVCEARDRHVRCSQAPAQPQQSTMPTVLAMSSCIVLCMSESLPCR